MFVDFQRVNRQLHALTIGRSRLLNRRRRVTATSDNNDDQHNNDNNQNNRSNQNIVNTGVRMYERQDIIYPMMIPANTPVSSGAAGGPLIELPVLADDVVDEVG